MRKRLAAGLLAVVLVLQLSGCMGGMFSRSVRSSGNTTTQTYDIRDFTGVRVHSYMSNLSLVLAEGDYGVQIYADQRYLDRIRVQKNGNLLSIETDDNLKFRERIEVRVTVPTLEELHFEGALDVENAGSIKADKLYMTVSGATDIDLSFDCSELNIEASGAAEVDLHGRADTFSWKGAGATELDASGLATQVATLIISGAGEASIQCSQTLNATVQGAGSIEYTGNCTVNKSIQGAGSIKQAD